MKKKKYNIYQSKPKKTLEQITKISESSDDEVIKKGVKANI